MNDPEIKQIWTRLKLLMNLTVSYKYYRFQYCSVHFFHVLKRNCSFSCQRITNYFFVFFRYDSLRSCPLCLSQEEGMIHFFVRSHVKIPDSGLFSHWLQNNTSEELRSDWLELRRNTVLVLFWCLWVKYSKKTSHLHHTTCTDLLPKFHTKIFFLFCRPQENRRERKSSISRGFWSCSRIAVTSEER